MFSGSICFERIETSEAAMDQTVALISFASL